MNYFAQLLCGIFLMSGLSACIGTDVIDEMEVDMTPEPVADTTTTDTTNTDTTTTVATARQGTLEGRGGYDAAGTVTLSQDDNGDILLTTSDDFTVTLALGTFLYLSNSESGSATAAEGLEVADVSDRLVGAQTFNVTQLAPDVDLSTYRYVIVLCKPARITFGLAELN